MSKKYISLHNHTMFSVMNSIVKPNDLFKTAAEYNMPAIAVTDYNSLAGIYDSYKASIANKVKLIVGCQLNIVESTIPYLAYNANNKLEKPKDPPRGIILIAKNKIGYKNLLLLNREGFNCKLGRVPLIDWNHLRTHNEGLICLTGDANGVLGRSISENNFDRFNSNLKLLKEFFNKDLYIEMCANTIRYDSCDQFVVNRYLFNLSKIDKELQIVPTSNTRYLKKEQFVIHDIIMAVKNGRVLSDKSRPRYDKDQMYLHRYDEIVKFFSRNFGEEFAKSICKNTIEVSDKCEIAEWTKPEIITGDKTLLPTFPCKKDEDYTEFVTWLDNKNDDKLSSIDEDKQFMRFKCEKNFTLIPDKKFDQYINRYNQELDIYEQLGFSSYMLITHDFLNWARKNGIPVGYGRGCCTKETKILTKNGYIPINEIKVGDKVFTHTGELQKVLNIFEYNVEANEDLVQIKTQHSFGNLSFTKNHKIYADKVKYTKKYLDYTKRGKITTKITKYKKSNNPTWIEIDKLNVDDLVYTKFPERNINLNEVPKTLLIQKTVGRNCNIIDEYHINIDDDFIYFLGRWVGDGCYSYNKDKRAYFVNISFNANDVNGISWFENFFKKLNLNVSIYNNGKNKVDVMVFSKSLAEFINKIFPNYKANAATKHLPDFYRHLSEHQLKLLLKGLMDSDGHTRYRKNRKIKECQITSCSKDLILQIKELLLYLKISSSVYTRKPKLVFNKYMQHISYDISFSCKYLEEQNINKGYYSRILEKKYVNDNKVYDITVENDTSYLTQNYVAHNSVGGSLVGYLLDIHKADPIKYGLIFERFLNIEKKAFPDIDNDVESIDREKVLQYVINKYGKDYVAHVSNYMAYTPKVAITDVITCLELGGSRAEAFKIAKNITESIPGDAKTINDVIASSKLFEEFCKEHDNIKEYSEQLIGVLRALSTHAAGIVISKHPLPGLVPLRVDDNNVIALEWEKERTEENGLVKIDFLGLETLSIIKSTKKIVKENYGIDIKDPDFDEYLPDVYDNITNGNTMCVFQLGASGGTIGLCNATTPRSIEDLAAINALARPGVPHDIKKSFIERKFEREPVIIPHPNLDRAVKATFGYCIFEESFLFLAHDFCGWDLQKSDKMRKISKLKAKGRHILEELKGDFIESAVKHSKVSPEFAESIWVDWVIPLAGYSFNKSHSILYSMTSYITAYLKTYYPSAFLTANLISETNSNSPQAKDNILKIWHALKKLGVKINQPDINKSDSNYRLINGDELFTGFSALHGVKEPAALDILKHRPFSSFEDLLTRTDSSKVRSTVIQALAVSGALDSFNLPRKTMFLYCSDLRKKLKISAGKKISYQLPKDEWSIGELRALEIEYLGKAFTGSKQDSFPKLFSNHKAISLIESLDAMPDESNVAIEGEVLDMFFFKVKKEGSKIFGKECCKLLMEDLVGDQCWVIMFPDRLANFRNIFSDIMPNRKMDKGFGMRLSGKLSKYNNETSIIVEDIYGLYEPIAAPLDLTAKTISVTTENVKKKKTKEVTVIDIEEDLLNILDNS